ncbi:hypothetical protein EZS27_019145 [termite gut metagenome]|uniref:Uncharacterized protein n=1 Tax=termite gut metagenome TaxID=433724 RepID=A0A5J4RE27_9ZZZZ
MPILYSKQVHAANIRTCWKTGDRKEMYKAMIVIARKNFTFYIIVSRRDDVVNLRYTIIVMIRIIHTVMRVFVIYVAVLFATFHNITSHSSIMVVMRKYRKG